MQKNDVLKNLLTRLSQLRKECREYLGGVYFTEITHDFGIYKMNIPGNEAFMSHAEHHFVELEKMFQALELGEYRNTEK